MENFEMLKLKIQHIAGWVAAAAVFSMATGCVTPAPVQKAPQAPTPMAAPEAAKEIPPGRLPDGRDGFVITETAKMSGADRRAFDEAVALLNTEGYDQAIEILKNVVAHSPGVTAPYINLGIAYARTDKIEEAEAQFKKALELIPGHPVAGNECGLLFRKKGRFEEARTMYEQVLNAYPNYYPVHRNLGILCDLYLSDLESALNHYQIYSQAMPKGAQVKLWIADLQGRMKAK
jgi:tetratricopeptide (TPR) repeat protein